MLTNFQTSFTTYLAKISSKAIVKYPTTPQTHCYTTLWNIDVRKTESTWSTYRDLRYFARHCSNEI